MRIHTKGTVRVLDIIFSSILILMFFDIPYIKRIISPLVVFALDILLLFLVTLYFYFGKKHLSGPTLIMLVYVGYFFIVTFFGSGRNGEFIFEMSPICFFVLTFSVIMKIDYQRYIDMLVWFLFLITLIDLLTIILFPRGLYESNSSIRNWFLGYETNRMLYSLPLLVLYYYSLSCKNLSLTLGKLIIPIVVLLDMILSGGDAGSVSIAIYMLLASIVFLLKKYSNRFYMLYTKIIYKYYLYVALFAAAFCFFILFRSSTLLVDIAVNVLSKSATLSNRIYIWDCCIRTITDNFIFGLGNLSAQDYREITRGFVNPHNIIFSYMLTGGAVGLCLLSSYIIICFRGLKKTPNNLFLLLGIYLILFLGLVSSTLSFSPFLFVFCIMIYDADNRGNAKIRGNEMVR